MAEFLDSRSGSKSPAGIVANAASQEEFTLHDVGAAISKQLGLSPESHEVAGLAGKLHAFVNNSVALRASGLDGADFRTLVISNLTPEIARAMDPSQAARIRLEQQQAGVGTVGNVLALGSGMRHMVNGVLVGDTEERQATSATYARAFGGNDPSLTSFEKLTRNYALQQGVMWAADNREILKLGTGAIDIIKQTHLRQETLTSLKDAGFSTKASVGIASMLHEHGKDANKDGQVLASKVKELGDPDITAAIEARAKLQIPAPNETPEQAQARTGQIPAADDQIRDTANAHIQKKLQDAAKVKDVTDTLGIKLEQNAATQKNENGQTTATADRNAKADAKDAKADAILADLNNAAPAQKPETPPPGANAAKPDKPASVKPVQRAAPQPK